MALTEVVRLRLVGKGFADLFDGHRAEWTGMAEDARTYMASSLGSTPTIDDIRKALLPTMEINARLRYFSSEKKPPLTQKYWIGDFTDYVLERVYQPELHIPAGEEKNSDGS